jgi:hypothetical protein
VYNHETLGNIFSIRDHYGKAITNMARGEYLVTGTQDNGRFSVVMLGYIRVNLARSMVCL